MLTAAVGSARVTAVEIIVEYPDTSQETKADSQKNNLKKRLSTRHKRNMATEGAAVKVAGGAAVKVAGGAAVKVAGVAAVKAAEEAATHFEPSPPISE